MGINCVSNDNGNDFFRWYISYSIYILAHTLPNFLVTMLEDGTVINTSNIYMTIFTFVSACVLAPIMEEVIFRGFFYSEWLINGD